MPAEYADSCVEETYTLETQRGDGPETETDHDDEETGTQQEGGVEPWAPVVEQGEHAEDDDAHRDEDL